MIHPTTKWRTLLLLAAAAAAGGCSRRAEDAPAPGVQHLAQRLHTAEDAPAEVIRRTFGGIGRELVKLPAAHSVSAPLLIPEGAELRFAVAVTGPTASCKAEVLARTGGRERSLWTTGFEKPERWSEATVDLAEHAGREIEIVLRADGDAKVTVYWGSPVVTDPAGSRRNLLLHEIDTLRADHLEPFGFPGRSSPVIGALARRSVVFSECYSTASWTRPAASSILTSLSAATHGVVWEESRLADDAVTLAEILRDAGWYTVAFQTNPHAGRPAGLDQGFDVVYEMHALVGHALRNRDEWEGGSFSTGDASGTTELVAFLLRDVLHEWAGLPLFLYLHPMDPHTPYAPRPPFADLPGFGTGGTDADEPLALYGRDVRAGDHFLGAILRTLEAAELLDRSVIAFVSDHGDEFGEHGRKGHGANLYNETIVVPFLMSAPGLLPEGRVRRERVSTLDLLPTTLELLGVGVPAGLEGRSLVPGLLASDAGRRFPPETTFSHVFTRKVRFFEKEAKDDPEVIGHVAAMQGPWKLVLSDYGARRKGSVELFDLRVDPAEASDVSADHPETVRAMEEAARSWWQERRAAVAATEEEPVDPELLEQMRALGYVQ